MSPDGKYAIIFPGIAKESSEKQKNVYLLNIKTLKIEGIHVKEYLNYMKTIDDFSNFLRVFNHIISIK